MTAPRHLWSIRVGGAEEVVVFGTTEPGLVELTAVAERPEPWPVRPAARSHENLIARVRVWRDAGVRVEVIERPWRFPHRCAGERWDLRPHTPGARVRSGSGDAFGAFLRELRRFADLAPVRDALEARVADTSRLALTLLDPEARALAMRFAPADRLAVHNELAVDPSGRLAQLAGTCPGLLALAAAGRTGYRSRLLGSIRRGVRLPWIIDELWDWSRAREREDLAPGVTPQRAFRPWLMRASSAVRGAHLENLPLGPIIGDDIPTGRIDNRRWYAVMSELFDDFVGRELPPDRADAFRAFCSRHAPLLDRRVPRRPITSWLIDACLVHDRWPSRRTDPDALIERARRWHRSLRDARRLGRQLSGRVVQLPELHPAPPRGRVLRVAPITTAQDLYAEGEGMGHCVYQFLPEALSGKIVFCHIEHRDESLTLAIRRVEGRWAYPTLSGFKNKSPSKAAMCAVRGWLRRRGIECRGMAGGDGDIPF